MNIIRIKPLISIRKINFLGKNTVFFQAKRNIPSGFIAYSIKLKWDAWKKR